MNCNNDNAPYAKLLKEVEGLRRENLMLKDLLQKHGIAFNIQVNDKECDGELSKFSPLTFPNVNLSIEDRAALFRSLFRGREDVFARRWYSKTSGKSGYQPACQNEWRQGVCDKRKQKCTDCPNRQLSALGYNDIYRHLEGRDGNGCDVIGLYAIMQDNCCAFLCVDFDDKNCEHGFKDDVKAFSGVCKDWGVPYSIERSRSGNGAHIWIFFERAIPAFKARRLGNAILTEAMNRNGCISFNSYDRFFPNQDTMPEGGFGNLVALPLQGLARKNLNSVFVDDDFLAYKDQWAYLYQVQKIDEDAISALLENHMIDDLGNLTASSESNPWVIPTAQRICANDFVDEMDIVKADKLYIPLKAISAKAVNQIKRIAAFKNPEFYAKEAMRLPTFLITRVISCAEFTDTHLAMPRGCEEAIVNLLKEYGINYKIIDKTNHGISIKAAFKGQERTEQLDAINALMPYTCGVLHATTAFGKTVTAASMIARRKVNTLILVHTKALLDQWHERLTEFLDIDYCQQDAPKRRGRKKTFSPIGCLDSTKNTLHGIVDVALLQSCLDDSEVKSFVQGYGMVIVDECHHVSSVTFEKVLKRVTAQYVYGLTATPIRKDGHQPIIFMQCGPIRFSADAKSQIEKQSFQRYLIPRFTSFHPIANEKKNFALLAQELTEDEIRNNLIIADVCKAVAIGRTPIILTNRTTHVDKLCAMLSSHNIMVIRLTGTISAKEKREAMLHLHNVPANQPLVVVATGKYVGEGFDYPRLDTLFLTMPISWKGLVAQYAGRLHREYPGKKDVRIYDYIDVHEPICDNMYRKRQKGYASIGYTTLNPGLPTLFDEVGDVSFSPTAERIFNGKTFSRTFINDILGARHSIMIASPRLYAANKNIIIQHLRELSSNGIQIAIRTKEENEQTQYLREQGIQVYVVPNLSVRCAIIDKTIVWYGSVQIVGFWTEEDSIIKICDTGVADELMNVVG